MATTKTVTYNAKISLMMHGFGDNQSPNPETVNLVETVVLKQLQDILREATANADLRNNKIIQPEDVIFLLRHDRHKMQRFFKYLELKYVELRQINSTDRETVPNKKMRTLKGFIENIDETGELLDTDEFDTIKYEREIRAERISAAMDEQKYIEYAKARQASFFSKHFSEPNKFQLWVDPQKQLNLTAATIEILELLAYGIVGHITDMALIIRQNNKRSVGDPLKMLTGSFYNSTMFNAPHIPPMQRDLTDFMQAQISEVPLTVGEVREVLRRCYMPQVGYVKFSNKSMLGKRKLFLY